MSRTLLDGVIPEPPQHLAVAEPARKEQVENRQSLGVVVAGVPERGDHARVEVIPYNALGDPDSDKFLPWLWQRMQEDDLVDYYFPGQERTGFATVVRMFSGDANVAIFKTSDESTGNTWDARIPGFITWTASGMGASNVLIAGVIFFRKWWDHKTTDEAARAAFKFWFDTLTPRADVILGVCPALHRAIHRYNLRIGFRETGRITGAHLYKGQKCDAVLYEVTREQWEEGLCRQQH